MAGFSYNGVDRLEADYSKLAQLGDEEKWSILEAGANVIKEFQQKYILETFTQRTGSLCASINVFKKRNGSGVYAQIYPSGNHSSYNRRLKTRTYKNSKHGRTYSIGGDSKTKTNAEVGYVLEYGSPRIKATHWMENANDAAGDDMEAAMAQVWDQRLKELNL